MSRPQPLEPLNVTLYDEGTMQMWLRIMRWGDFLAFWGLNIITVVLTRDAKDVRVRREDDDDDDEAAGEI